MLSEAAEITLMIDSRDLREPQPGQSSYASLITAAKAGDSDAFEQLIALFHRKVLTTAWRLLGNQEDARDAAQETFLRAFKYLRGFKADQDFSGWLYRIVVNACRDLARKRRYREHATSIDTPAENTSVDSLASAEDLEAAAIRSQKMSMVSRALSTLSDKERAALVLRDIEGHSTEEVAQILGSSQTTVRSQISSARTKIKLYHERIIKRGWRS